MIGDGGAAKFLIDKLEAEQMLKKEEFIELLDGFDGAFDEYLAQKARAAKQEHYGANVYLRGLIEFTSWCKNDCLYCGIRAGNKNAQRYRLSHEEILKCCRQGHALGFRTFVLQGGEDPFFNDDLMCAIVRSIRLEFEDCAITLSLGERSRQSYQRLFDAGADRYLLRHETANFKHYGALHPKTMSLEKRMRCLWELKEIGYQVGCGFMVESPGQTSECIAEDLMFIKRLEPQMVGIGPFIPHKDTAFAKCRAGTLEKTLMLISVLRLMLPKALLPATTALGSISPLGRELGILHGANVLMPNLSPVGVRKKYMLYDNKICTGEEAAECRRCLQSRMEKIGCSTEPARGDAVGFDRLKALV
ncbi:MAG: [FeFe] hydrogenase H-cluster radical SAM maturase HydE [Clostridiales bacterium]|jgi:biotin synthase|nr:[FeFe] hydrogenase H-cluster radical SAM maturase HydE [Clostridiales bacterium]